MEKTAAPGQYSGLTEGLTPNAGKGGAGGYPKYNAKAPAWQEPGGGFSLDLEVARWHGTSGQGDWRNTSGRGGRSEWAAYNRRGGAGGAVNGGAGREHRGAARDGIRWRISHALGA